MALIMGPELVCTIQNKFQAEFKPHGSNDEFDRYQKLQGFVILVVARGNNLQSSGFRSAATEKAADIYQQNILCEYLLVTPGPPRGQAQKL